MSSHILIVDADHILNSEPIQIIHKHPDFSHKRRTDLDPWEFIATSYPIALANKIVPFLDQPASPVTATRARTRSPKRQKSTSPTRRTRTAANEANSDNKRARSPRKRSPAKVSSNGHLPSDTAVSQEVTLADLPTPCFTPARWRDPLPTATPGTIDTVYTSRTVSPGGTLLSPLRTLPDDDDDGWSPVPLRIRDSAIPSAATIPSTLFTPAKTPAPTPQLQPSLPPLTVPPPLLPPRLRPYKFDKTPTVLMHHVSLPILTLRHDLPTSAIRDVFNWCYASVAAGRIVELEGWLIHFRDTSRAREIMEACLMMRLDVMARKAEALLEGFEKGFAGREERSNTDGEQEKVGEQNTASNGDQNEETMDEEAEEITNDG